MFTPRLISGSFEIKVLLSETSSALLILLFSYAAIMKLIDHNNFQRVLSQSELIGRWSQGLAFLIPIIELVTAFMLFIPNTRIIGLFISAVLMCMFTLYVFYMMKFMPHLPCSCGGVIKKMSWSQHLTFNIIFTFVAVLEYVLSNNIKRSNKPETHSK